MSVGGTIHKYHFTFDIQQYREGRGKNLPILYFRHICILTIAFPFNKYKDSEVWNIKSIFFSGGETGNENRSKACTHGVDLGPKRSSPKVVIDFIVG